MVPKYLNTKHSRYPMHILSCYLIVLHKVPGILKLGLPNLLHYPLLRKLKMNHLLRDCHKLLNMGILLYMLFHLQLLLLDIKWLNSFDTSNDFIFEDKAQVHQLQTNNAYMIHLMHKGLKNILDLRIVLKLLFLIKQLDVIKV